MKHVFEVFNNGLSLGYVVANTWADAQRTAATQEHDEGNKVNWMDLNARAVTIKQLTAAGKLEEFADILNIKIEDKESD